MENFSGWVQAALFAIINLGMIVYLSGRLTSRVDSMEKADRRMEEAQQRMEQKLDGHISSCMTRELFDSNVMRLEQAIEHVARENKMMMEEVGRRRREKGLE